MLTPTSIRNWTTRLGIGAAVFLVPMLVCAQGAVAGINPQTGIASWVVWMIGGLNLLTWVAFLFLNILLDPNFIFALGGDNSIVPMLNLVWQLSRDLMNIAFAILLIAAAIYTVITANKEFVSQHLKKFVLAVVLVNFSWFIPRVILDVGSIAASTVFSIPSLIVTQQSSEACKFTTSKAIDGLSCTPQNPEKTQYSCQCGAVTDARFFLSTSDAKKMKDNQTDGWSCPLGPVMCVQMENLNVKTVAGYSAVLNGLIINFARLQGLATVPAQNSGSNVYDTVMFLLKEAVVLVIHLALFFPLAAMVLAFAIRIPVLWLTMAFAPFFFLSFLIPDKFTAGYPQKILDEFLKAAFLPAIVGIPLTIGFIMVNAMQTASAAFDPFKTVSFKLTDNISTFWDLLWLGMTLGVIWIGVFEMLGKMGIMSAGSNAIKGAGESIGRMAIKAPLHVPLPGIGISPLAMLRTMNPRNVENVFNSSSSLADFGKKMGDASHMGKVSEQVRSANRYAKDDVQMGKLVAHLTSLERALRTPGDVAGRKTAIAAINSDFDIHISETNPHADLKEYLKALQAVAARSGKVDAEVKPKIDALPPAAP